MKKLLLLLFVVSLAFISCTDNTEEYEELLKEERQSVEKGGNTTIDGDSGDTGSNEED